MTHSASALLPTSSSPRNRMTTLENVVSFTTARSTRSVKPDTVAIGDQPTTSSVNRLGSNEAPPTSASIAFNSTSLRDSLIGAPVSVFRQAGAHSRAEYLRLRRRELVVRQRARGVQLCEVFDLVRRVRRRWRVLRLPLVVAGRRLIVGRRFLLGLLVGVRPVPVVSDRRAGDERPASGPSPEPHENPFPFVRPQHVRIRAHRAPDRRNRPHPGRVSRPPKRPAAHRQSGAFGPPLPGHLYRRPGVDGMSGGPRAPPTFTVPVALGAQPCPAASPRVRRRSSSWQPGRRFPWDQGVTTNGGVC